MSRAERATGRRPKAGAVDVSARFPALVTVKLSTGYVYKTAATDDEARAVIEQLAQLAIADAPSEQLPRREGPADEQG